VPAEAITVVHNGTIAPAPARPAARTSFPSICVLGRLVPHKRVELALEAAARIRDHLPGLRVLVAGHGYWEPRLREVVDRLGLRDAVELLGWVDEEAKQRLLASSWALAMPSLKEGWGLVISEAGMHATPTVAFRSAGGTRESVADQRSGLLVEDSQDFESATRTLLAGRGLRERLGAGARELSTTFTWEHARTSFAVVLAAALHGQRIDSADPHQGDLGQRSPA